jgi:predicted RNase H-like nuclease (RuvC/YqgF family)
LIGKNDKDTKQHQDKLDNEKLTNKVIEYKHTNSLLKMETDIIGDRLEQLKKAIDSLGDAKQVEDKMNNKLKIKHNEIEKMKSQLKTLEIENSNLLDKLDKKKNDLKLHNTGYIKKLKEKESSLNSNKAHINNMEKGIFQIINPSNNFP